MVLVAHNTGLCLLGTPQSTHDSPVSVTKPLSGVTSPKMMGTSPQVVNRLATRNRDSTAYPRVPMMISGMLISTTAALQAHATAVAT